MQVKSPVTESNVEIPWYYSKGFIVLMLIFFFPVGILLLWLSPAPALHGRLIWTAIIGLGLIIMYSNGDPTTAPVVTTPITSNRAPSAALNQLPPATMTPTIAPSPAPAPTPRPIAVAKPAQTWQVLKEWSGSGIKSTETFVTTRNEWRIKWEATDKQIAGILQIYVYNGNGDLVTLVANAVDVGSDTSYIRGKPGPYYLDISSFGFKWNVQVEEQR